MSETAPRLPRLIHQTRVQMRYLRRRDGDNCHLCGGVMTFDRGADTSATRDHVIPRSEGGGGVMSNFRLAHQLCNERRGNAAVSASCTIGLYPEKFTLVVEETPGLGWVVTSDAHPGFRQAVSPHEGLQEGLRKSPAILRLVLVADRERAERRGER